MSSDVSSTKMWRVRKEVVEMKESGVAVGKSPGTTQGMG